MLCHNIVRQNFAFICNQRGITGSAIICLDLKVNTDGKKSILKPLTSIIKLFLLDNMTFEFREDELTILYQLL